MDVNIHLGAFQMSLEMIIWKLFVYAQEIMGFVIKKTFCTPQIWKIYGRRALALSGI